MGRIICVILTLLITVLSFPITTAAASTDDYVLILGDVNEDGKVDLPDASALQWHLVRLPVPAYSEAVADVDDDGTVDISDATFIQRYTAGVPYSAVGIGEQIIKSARSGQFISILGASISTYEGYITEGNINYYPHSTNDPHPVDDVNHTYWMRTVNALGLRLLVNNSSAGSFCTTGYGRQGMETCSDRCVSLHTEEHEPDIIVIQIGGNDFNYEVPLGDYNGTQGGLPMDTTTFRESYAVMLNKILTRYKRAQVICGTIPMMENNLEDKRFPEKNSEGVLLEDYNKAIREIASLFGVDVVEFNRCGITYQNLDIYMQDYSSKSGYAQHPNRYGHALMANALIRVIDSSSKSYFTD